MLLSYPLAGLLKRVPDAKPAYKNLFITSYVHRLPRTYWRRDLGNLGPKS